MLDDNAINKAVAMLHGIPPRAEVRKLVIAIIETYLKHSNKHTNIINGGGDGRPDVVDALLSSQNPVSEQSPTCPICGKERKYSRSIFGSVLPIQCCISEQRTKTSV